MTEKDRSCTVAVQYKKKAPQKRGALAETYRTMSERQDPTIQLVWLGQGIYYQSILQLPPVSQKRSCRSDRK